VTHLSIRGGDFLIQTSDAIEMDVFFKLAKKNKAKLNKLTNLNIIIDLDKHQLSALNQFKTLEYIEVYTSFSLTPQSINLKNLKVLKIKDPIIYSPIKLDTPNLIELEYYGSLDGILIKNPLSIARLTTYIFDDEVIRFKNLQYLNIQRYRPSDSDLLKRLPKLKEIFFHIQDLDDFNQIEYQPKIDELLKHRLESGRSDVKVYCDDIYLVDGKSYEDFELEDDNGYKYLCNWNNLTDRIPLPIERINYTDIMRGIEEHHNNQFPADLFKRFFNLNYVELGYSYKLDADRFISFLSNLHNIHSLYLNYAPYNQSFYDQLPIACPYLKHLVFEQFSGERYEKNEEDAKENENKDADMKKERLNFNFALQFKMLDRFGTNQEFTIDEIRSISSKNIRYLIFYFKGFAFFLTRNEEDTNTYKYNIDCNYAFDEMECKCQWDIAIKYFCHCNSETKVENAEFNQIMDYFINFDPEDNEPNF